MKQVLQHARTGKISVAEVPAPLLQPGCVLVGTAASLVSAGTERAASEFARKSLLQKARARPDLARDVVSKIRRDGIVSAVQAVRSRLDEPQTLGYGSSGTVVAVGEGVTDLRVGDRVACAGANHAVHGELACIPRLLVARIPPDAAVSFEEAAFSTVGAVALHGIRTADVKLGEVVAIIGLGLLGQLTVQLLKAAGCGVVGMDLNPYRADLAMRLGADSACSSAEEFRDLCLRLSGGHGADAVLIAAETPSNSPVNLAGEVARDRGVVVAVGTVGLDIQRRLYYEKELDFRIPRSYGPGRYDAAYELKGRDYPIGYVRWTETRNMEAFVQLLAEGKLDVKSLVTHRFPIERAQVAYDLIAGKSPEPFLAVLITYPEASSICNNLELVTVRRPASPRYEKKVSIGVLGVGSFAQSTLLPTISGIEGIERIAVCGATGPRARYAATKFQFEHCSTDEGQVLSDPAINTIVIATQHHLHAGQVVAALESGKHVFCEKPLCLNERELQSIVRTHLHTSCGYSPLLMVGFNRRFAPMATRMKAFLANVGEPIAMHYRVNAGFVPADHWVNDPEEGGGRILGEACHFIDFLTFISGSSVTEVETRSLANSGRYSNDNVVISLQFANGSQGTISYLANGDKRYSKERLDVFGGGAVASLDDFRRLELVRYGRKQVFHSHWRQDKGHRNEWSAFASAIRGAGPVPIPFEQIVLSTLATLRAEQSRATGEALAVDGDAFIERALNSWMDGSSALCEVTF
jgi:predicted dehydrogenase/threonine dehydrogenase-like Zn-dependent dehydrogenase